MQLAVGDDLNVRAVLQLLALTKPPVITDSRYSEMLSAASEDFDH